MKAAVHVGQLLQPVPGGIGRYVRHLVAALPGAGVDVHAFAAGPAPDRMAPYTDLGWPTGPVRYEAWHRFRRPVVKVPGDLLHSTSLAVAPAGRRPLVVTVHDLVFLRQPEHLTSRGVSFHRRGLAIARREAASVIVPTEFGKDDLVSEGFEAERIHVAHHGVATPDEPDPAVVGAVLEWLGIHPPFLLFVGTIEPRKGVVDVLDAHTALRADHPDLTLVLAGPPGWGESPDLDRPGVVATGNVGDRELDALYRSATALVLPERYSGGFSRADRKRHQRHYHLDAIAHVRSSAPPLCNDRRDGEKLHTLRPRRTEQHRPTRLLPLHRHERPGVERHDDHAALRARFRRGATASAMKASNASSSIGGAR